jgi:hypothetical protein
MPWRVEQLGRLGVQFQWTTKDLNLLERIHNEVIQVLQEVSLSELRGVGDLGKQLSSLGLPFIPIDAPLPDSLKRISTYIKRAI